MAMYDAGKNYRLKRQYRLGIVDDNNYILSITGYKCVFLNPVTAFMLHCILNMTLPNAEKRINELLKLSEIDTYKHVSELINRLSDYIEIDNRERLTTAEPSVDESLTILKQKKNYKCPIEKSKIPKKIKFYLTDYCPRHCVYCFAGAKFSKEKMINSEFISVKRFKEIIIEASSIGVKEIEISGGDPFVLSNIFDYIDIMIKHFTGVWSVSTKAFLSKEDVKKLKNIGLKEIQVSIDSFNAATADKMMGDKGAFKEVKETMSNILEENLVLCTNTVVTSLNIYDLPDLFEKLINFGGKYIRFSYYYMSGNRHKDYLFPTNEQFLWLNEKMPPLVEKAKSRGIFSDFTLHEPNKRENNDKTRTFCGGFTDAMSVRYDGSVLFCDSLNHCEDFVSGNLKDASILETWNSQAALNMNNPSYFFERYKGTKCYTCHMYTNCFYKRCYVRTFNRYGTYFDIDPACPFGDEDYILMN